jgi:hypothetical protein
MSGSFLTCDTISYTYMTYGPRKRCPEGRAPQPSSPPARAIQPAQAVGKLARECSISPRQAYRYLQQAQHLKEPVPIGDAKSAFTVKLSQGLIAKVRRYAASTGLSIGEAVTRALLAWLRRERGRG